MHAFDFSSADAIAADHHRGSNMKLQIFPYFTEPSCSNVFISIGRIPIGRFSPPHCHNFDQVRYMIEGSSDYGGWRLEPGDCGYFPSSVPYGPQSQDEDARVLTLQFPGDANAYYPTPAELAGAVARLKAADPGFGTGGVGRDAAGEERDSFELAWEELRGEPIRYAPPRYTAPIVMKPGNFAWRRDAGGRTARHLGTFGDCRLSISMVRLHGAGTMGDEAGRATEFWFLLAGRLDVDGVHHGPHSGFVIESGGMPARVAADAAEFLVVRLPERFAGG